jgi:hypothetical protein
MSTPSAAILSRVIRLQHMQTWQGRKRNRSGPFRLWQCSARTGFSMQENPAGRSPGLSVAMEKYPRVQLGLIGVLIEELDPATS